LVTNQNYTKMCGQKIIKFRISLHRPVIISPDNYQRRLLVDSFIVLLQLIRPTADRRGRVTKVTNCSYQKTETPCTINHDITKYARYILRGCRSRWLCGLTRRSAAALLLGSQVRLPLTAWAFVCCVLCRHRHLRRADHSLRGVLTSVCVIGCGLETSKNEVVHAQFGLLRHRRNKILRGSGFSNHCRLTALSLTL